MAQQLKTHNINIHKMNMQDKKTLNNEDNDTTKHEHERMKMAQNIEQKHININKIKMKTKTLNNEENYSMNK